MFKLGNLKYIGKNSTIVHQLDVSLRSDRRGSYFDNHYTAKEFTLQAK